MRTEVLLFVAQTPHPPRIRGQARAPFFLCYKILSGWAALMGSPGPRLAGLSPLLRCCSGWPGVQGVQDPVHLPSSRQRGRAPALGADPRSLPCGPGLGGCGCGCPSPEDAGRCRLMLGEAGWLERPRRWRDFCW